ncbi:VCBS repeat-containing protein [Dokdonia donghaensis]|uniref:VCBS repeat-containing protein n=1 Tax=Dokdonia donghaensis TaxID=326320 RepID=UPI000B0C820F|nr:VCBS repeat-containing protein [Dokdonia donghaensis]
MNILDFQYLYNGGGIGIGDFNNDNQPDILFTGNQVSSALYLNKGSMTFKDITSTAGVTTNAWITGVSIIDINTDGWDDIYLNVGGANCVDNCHNLLFINQQNNPNDTPTFQEKAKEYGLADGKYSQQTVFLDYDQDGDLDAFTIRNGNSTFSRNTPYPKNKFPNHLKDILLENQGVDSLGHPYFKDVSKERGITEKGFSLGVAIADINGDQLPDLYVTNDFITNDVLYINQGKDANYAFAKAQKQLPSSTFNAMGVDIADLNNDTFPDITVVDMLPNDYERQKKMIGFNNYDKFLLAQRNDYTPQYVSNTLQLHNGMNSNTILPFSEIGHQSGIASTDWSWAPLAADFDNDGNKDLYITNGYVKDITDLDFINYSGTNNSFGTPEAKQKKLQGFVDALPGIHLPNYVFRNNGNAAFTEVSSEWITPENSFSNGAAYADLDQDGDLDLIVNNINAPAYILQNNADRDTTNYLRIKLRGTPENKDAIGSSITLWQNGKSQTQYQSVVRGYLSSVESILHFGLTSSTVDSLKVIWPDGSVSKDNAISANQVLTLDISEASKENASVTSTNTLLTQVPLINHTLLENPSNDFRQQALLPHQFNRVSGAIAVANINESKGDELFLGGNSKTPSILLSESADGSYIPIQNFDQVADITSALFLDVDGDGDQDLYVGHGGTDARDLHDKILINESGEFSSTQNLLPEITTNTASALSLDFDTDGDLDLFVLGGVQSGAYPKSSKSYLLKNTNGTFKVHQELSFEGIPQDVTISKDQKQLQIVGEWMEITAFDITNEGLKQAKIQFKNTQEKNIDTRGWWNTITTADIDNDGDDDLLLGNQGNNGFMKPSFDQPVYVYNQDFDGNGSIDPVLAQYFGDTGTPLLKPIHTRDDIMQQLVVLKKRYGTYNAFAKADFKTLLNIKNLDEETLHAATFQSAYAENIGDNTFILKALPTECQRSTINDFVVSDLDGDGYKEVLAVQNDLTAEANYGNYDAGIGLYLKGTSDGLTYIPNRTSGFVIPGQSNSVKTFKNNKGETFVIATETNGETRVFAYNKTSTN